MILTLILSPLIALAGAPKEINSQYAHDKYRHFSFYSLKQETGPKQGLHLESDITESYGSPESEEARKKAPKKSVRKFYHKLKLYFDNQEDAAIELDLSSLKLGTRHSSKPAKILEDTRVVESMDIPLPEKVYETFKKLKPQSVELVIFDKEGRVVEIADVVMPDVWD